jgi:hypothetical protein
MRRRRELLMGTAPAIRVEKPKPPIVESVAQEVESDVIEAESAPRKRGHERPYAAQIDCPGCEETLEAQNSILQSVRCEGCGYLLGFDEMMALRTAEHARTSRYV